LFRRRHLQKTSEKLRKVVLLLVTWGVLLGFFLAYENYFVISKKDYLIDQEFRNLSRLAAQLSAEFDRARLSVTSLAKIMRFAKEGHRNSTLSLDCRYKDNIGTCFEAYTKTYLGEVWDGKSPSPSVRGRFFDCLGKDPEAVRLGRQENSSGLQLVVRCPPAEESETKTDKKSGEPEPVFRLDMKPWVQIAFDEYKQAFEDILIADETGRVLFQQSDRSTPLATEAPPES
jgi:hypothetical protein